LINRAFEVNRDVIPKITTSLEHSMRLDDLIAIVENSSINDWQKLDVHTTYGWEWGQKQGQNYLEPKTHSKLAVFNADVDISLAMDATVTEDFAESWTQKFASPKASSVAIWLRYRGAVVHEWVYVVVDGGRYLLPMPAPDSAGGYQIPNADLKIAQLFFDLYGVGGPHQTVSAALQHAGVKIV
jgi:hypothetical protein